MKLTRGATTALLSLLLIATPAPAAPQDSPASPPAPAPKPRPAPKDRTAGEDLDAARALMKAEKWADAATAFRRVFEVHRGSNDVHRRAVEIEEDLKACLFRAQLPAPKAADLFGPRAKSLDQFSRKLVYDFPQGPEGPGWEGAIDRVAFLKTRFEGETTIELDANVRGTGKVAGVAVMVCYEPDRAAGYLVTPGFSLTSGDMRYSQDTAITLLEGEGRKSGLASTYSKAAAGSMHVKVKRTFSQITLSIDKDVNLTVSHSGIKGGLVGIHAGSVNGLRISGVVEALHLRSVQGAWQEARYREWLKDSWDREAVLPEWIREGASTAASAAASPVQLPADVPSPPPDDVVVLLDLLREGNVPDFLDLSGRARVLSPHMKLLVEGLTCLAEERRAEAVAVLTRLAEADPAFAPARLYRGLALLGGRDLDGARKDLESAKEAAKTWPDLWVALATIAVLDGDIERAATLLEEARSLGARGPMLDGFQAFVVRSRRGPPWTRRFEAKAKAATVASDHSVQLCNEVGRTLDLALSACTGLFPRTTRPAAPVRVYVFASREGYLNYSGDLNRRLDSTAGAYLPKVRELVLFVPEVSREELWGTIRHEAFHAFLHDLVEEAPPWFDEGWAQCMERGKVEFGTIRMSPLEPERMGLLRFKVNVRGFMSLDHGSFMRNANVHYPLAQALVTYLFTSEKPRYRERLMGYLESLREGRSPKEAYAKHFEPVISGLDTGFNEWLRSR